MAINSRRIAKNTVFLYARLLLILGVTLYSSRVILEVLGATDYGLFYAVYSVIGLLAFLNGTLSGGSARFITYELGRGNEKKLSRTFSTTLYSHVILSLIILFVGESIGLWYANNILVIPDGRPHAALVVYQISIINTILSITQVPFTAEIIAHEKMDIYAYLGIYEAVTKLVVVYLLVNSGFDKLIYYATLQLIVSASVFIFYVFYCLAKYKEVSLSIRYDRKILKEIMSFSGWNLIANISETIMTQGVIMLYNLFFQPVVVAAQAIGNQISQAMMQFVNNVRQAVNPQIIKLYADQQYKDSQHLTLKSSEYILYLLLLLGVPCIMVMPAILKIWLVEVPEYTVAFARLIIAQQILGNFSAAFYTPMLAANKVRKNSIISAIICILQFGILALLFKFGCGPLWARYLGLLSCILFSFIIKPYILWKDINYDLLELKRCIIKSVKILFLVVLICGITYISLPQNNIISSLLVAALSICIVIVIAYKNLGSDIKTKIWSMMRSSLK